VQPGVGDDGGGQRRCDRRGQNVQALHQQALALDLGMTERRTLFLVSVDLGVEGIDIGLP
jgi:hypothetical protein